MKYLFSLVCVSMGLSNLFAQVPKPKLTAAEIKAVDAYLNLLRGCCIPDGAIVMVDNGPKGPVWIAPYFGDFVALALLAANDSYKADAKDVTRVENWILWRVARQEKGGYWFDYVGTTRANYKSNGQVDAHDSSAAMFLLVLERFRKSGGKITPKMQASAKAAFKCIQDVTDEDGLTWAKPDYQVKFLMDNIEVYAGLHAARDFFTKLKEPDLAKACAEQLEKLAKRLPEYYGAKEKSQFAWAKHSNGNFDGGFEKLYPHGLAGLFGISFVKTDGALFEKIQESFQPGTGPADTGAERFFISACRIGGKAATKWRTEVLNDNSLFNATKTYSYRPALAVLGLLEGSDWMPSLNR
ncbi:MAG: hypothetical protein N2112_08340 [Gemmataceae bacterium]|jgi:hypothetical protein|nr:hypothetical protein [Gemmataceae bacterium]